MECFPSEILQMIFSSFPLEYQVSNFRPVCRSWAEAVDTSPAWIHYSFEIYCTRKNDFLMLKNMPSLQMLQIFKVDAATTEALSSLQLKLRVLQIQGTDLDLDVSKVAGIISSCSYSLQKLSLSCEIFRNNVCAKVISQCIGLEELALVHPYSYKCDSSLIIIADSGCPLKKFYFSRYVFSSTTLSYFFCKKGKNLTSLTLLHFGVDFPEYITNCREYDIIELHLRDESYCDETVISNQGVMEELWDVMDNNYKEFYWIETALNNKTFSNLAELSIGNLIAGHRIPVKSIFDNCRLLQVLELELLKLNDDDLEEIHKCTNLSTLRNTSSCPITGVGLSHIAKCNKLTVLYINILGPVDDLAVNSLLKMQNLITLELPKTTLPPEFYFQIATNMTQLRTLCVFTLRKSLYLQMQKSLPNLKIRSWVL